MRGTTRGTACGCSRGEIGVRLALGASGSDVLSLVVGRAIRVAVGGAAVGSMAAWAAAPALGGLVYGVAPRDPVTLGAAAVLLIGAAAVAAYLPARAVRRVDLINALRVD